MDKTDYLSKMNEIIDDKSKSIELGLTSDFDNLNKIEKYIIHLIYIVKKLVNKFTMMLNLSVQ